LNPSGDQTCDLPHNLWNASPFTHHYHMYIPCLHDQWENSSQYDQVYIEKEIEKKFFETYSKLSSLSTTGEDDARRSQTEG
jgi:hypothetical protein